MQTLNVKLTFTEGLLGTAPSDPDIYAAYIASKSPDAQTLEEEVAAVGVEKVLDNSLTVFPKTKDGKPFLYDYQIKGFFKEACAMLQVVGKNESAKLKAYKKKIDGLVFVAPRVIPLELAGDMDTCQRSLRASTAKGDRTALANSQEAPAGTSIQFSVTVLSDDLLDAVREWLEYGVWKGLGQWRNSGKGRFTFEELASDEVTA